MSSNIDVVWLVIGFTGQLLFSARFLVQWLVSEKRRESIIPPAFWYLSLFGGVTLLMYAIYKHDPVFIAGQATGVLIYTRNIMLLRESARTAEARS
jgi:lipid-A-disaccharide synthase-like uncharacterized protein